MIGESEAFSLFAPPSHLRAMKSEMAISRQLRAGLKVQKRFTNGMRFCPQ